jgi:hypothetical protein
MNNGRLAMNNGRRLVNGSAVVAAAGLLLAGASAHAQYHPDAKSCTFDAPASVYGWGSDVKPAGRLLLVWSPSTKAILEYRWYFDPYVGGPFGATPPPPVCWDPAVERTRHEGEARLYSLLDQAAGPNEVSKTPASSSHFVHASVRTMLGDGDNPGHKIHAQMHPSRGGDALWHFSGILEQTGTGWIAAGGPVTCR